MTASRRATRQEPDRTGTVGLYRSASQAWQLNREATLLLGAGPRALLLQIAHPLVAEGVDQHSDFRAHPWRRLMATLRSYLAIVYGTSERAHAEIHRLNQIHRRIRGTVRDPVARALAGRTYRARDPELSLWVHATLIDSTVATYEAWIAPLAPGRKAAFYEETRQVGRAFGIPERVLPADLGAFEAYWSAMLAPGGPIQVTPTARRLAETILHPPLGRVPSRLYDWTLLPAVTLLPLRLRDEYGIPWEVPHRAVAAWLIAGFRFWRPRLPAGVRWMPQALVADRRVHPALPGGAG